MKLQIREATFSDTAAIRQIHLDAFGSTEGPTVSKLVLELLQDETAKSVLTLVAETQSEIVGCIIFSAVTIQGSESATVYILAPLAVASHCQRKGIGRALIEHGLHMLQAKGADLVLVLGDPNYYGKYGFDYHHYVLPPHPLPYPQAWMALELRPGALEAVRGLAVCANTLNAPEHW